MGRETTKDITFTVSKENTERARKVLEENKPDLGFHGITTNENLSKISIVGSGMINNPGIAAQMFEALYRVGINIHMISTSEIKISCLIDLDKSDIALQAVHDRFFPQR